MNVVTDAITQGITQEDEEEWLGPSALSITTFTNSTNPGVSPYSFTHTQTGDALLVLVAIKGSSTTPAALTMTAAFNAVNVPEIASNNADLHLNNPTLRAYLLATGAAQGAHTLAVTFSAGQAAQCVAIAAYDIDATAGAGLTPLQFTTTSDIASLSQAMTLDSDDSLTMGLIGVLGGDTDPFVRGAGYTEDAQGQTGSSISQDIGYLVQHRRRGALFDATWAAADNTGAVAVELLPVVVP